MDVERWMSKLKSCYEHTRNNVSGCKMSKSNNSVHGFRIHTVTVTTGPTVGSSFESSHLRTTISEW